MEHGMERNGKSEKREETEGITERGMRERKGQGKGEEREKGEIERERERGKESERERWKERVRVRSVPGVTHMESMWV